MILDIDHIALSSSNISKFIEIFSKFDYDVEFNEKNVKNSIIKKKYMKNFSPNHDLCLLNSKSNINIELLHHEQINKENGFITPIFENFKKSNHCKGLDMKLKNYGIPYILKQSNKIFSFNKFIVQSNNIEKSDLFWNDLGFKKINQKQHHYIFQSIISLKKYELFMEFSRNGKNNFLDDHGWNCISLLTNSIINEKKNLGNKYETTKIDTLLINEKKIDLFFVRGPSNELVEIISIK